MMDHPHTFSQAAVGTKLLLTCRCGYSQIVKPINARAVIDDHHEQLDVPQEEPA